MKLKEPGKAEISSLRSLGNRLNMQGSGIFLNLSVQSSPYDKDEEGKEKKEKKKKLNDL